MGRPTSFGDFLTAAQKVPGSVHDAWHPEFFLDPVGRGTELRETALKAKPTLVIGIDFLFWFAYGYMPDARRADSLERGLGLLEAIECPLVIADLPDMRRASDPTEVMIPFLAPRQIPSVETLATLNARIEAWAKERKGVTVLPLSRFVRSIEEETPITVRDETYESDDLIDLLQDDLLHPSPEGYALLTQLLFETLIAEHDEITAEHVAWGSDGLIERLEKRTARAAPAGAKRAVSRE